MADSGKPDRGRNWTQEEVSVLCQFVHKHSAQLFGTSCKGKKSSANVERVKASYWVKAAQALAENGGHPRHFARVRKKWQDLSSKPKAYHRDMQRTGKY